MRRFNWSCNQCSMSSGRRYSVERHIKNLHGGSGVPIPFEEYIIGRRNGIYIPKQMSRQARFQRAPKFIEIIDQELTKKAVQMALSNLEKNPADIEAIENFIRLKIQNYISATRQAAFYGIIGMMGIY
jgi:hypothetical protein